MKKKKTGGKGKNVDKNIKKSKLKILKLGASKRLLGLRKGRNGIMSKNKDQTMISLTSPFD